MKFTVTLDGAVDFAPQTEIEEILQNVRTILCTRIGTVPLDRDFGITWDHIDKPYPVAKSLMVAESIDAVEKYEPRVRVESIEFDETTEMIMEGISKPRVIVSIGEEEGEEE